MDDYIPRKAVCYQLEKQAMIDGQPRAIKRARRIVEEFPAADVAPVRHGRWIKYAPCNSDLMTCSKCEKYWIFDGDQYDYHYCPNCGARMDMVTDCNQVKDGDRE